MIDERLSEDILRKFRAVRWYEDHHHVPGCSMPDLSYCLDCHTDVDNITAELRRLGFERYPEGL